MLCGHRRARPGQRPRGCRAGCRGARGASEGASVAASRVRAVAPEGFVIGRSVHSPGEGSRAARDGGLDFLVFGTVFDSASKPGVSAAGTAMLAATCEAVSLPVLGVGGMIPSRLHDVAVAGAAGFAAIGVFAETSTEQFPDLMRQANAAYFDAMLSLTSLWTLATSPPSSTC